MNMIKTIKMKKLKDILNEVISERLARGLQPLLKLGSKVGWNTMSEDALLDLSDKFEQIDDEDADSIASHLNMSIELRQDGDRGAATKMMKQFNKVCKDALKGKPIKSAFENVNKISEAKQLQTKIFDQGSLQDSMKQVREMVGIEEADEKWPSDKKVEYDEFRFANGTGGFSFKWEHGVKHFGSLGLSLRQDGNHMLYASSMYNGKRFGNEKIDPKTLPTPNKDFLRHIRTWKDLDNLTMQTIITVLSKDVEKNEAAANKAFEQDRQAQSDFYSGGGKGYFKQDGRIGYGL